MLRVHKDRYGRYRYSHFVTSWRKYQTVNQGRMTLPGDLPSPGKLTQRYKRIRFLEQTWRAVNPA